MPSGFFAYFDQRFPLMLMHVYGILEAEPTCVTNVKMCGFFVTPAER